MTASQLETKTRQLSSKLALKTRQTPDSQRKSNDPTNNDHHELSTHNLTLDDPVYAHHNGHPKAYNGRDENNYVPPVPSGSAFGFAPDTNDNTIMGGSVDDLSSIGDASDSQMPKRRPKNQ